MRVRLEYGREGLEVDLPDANLAGVLKLTPADPIADPTAATAQAVNGPIDTRPLAEMARGRRNACIVVCDGTRPVPNAVLLPPILDALAAAGLRRNRVTVLVSTGTHRPNTAAEVAEILGRDVALSCN